MLNDELIQEMRELVRKEGQTLWAQSDLLAGAGLSDHEYEQLAGALQRRVSTLRERENVGRQWKPEDRDLEVSYTVHKALLRVTDHDARLSILREQGREWRVDALEKRIVAWQAEQDRERLAAVAPKGAKPEVLPGQAAVAAAVLGKGGMKLGAIPVKGFIRADGTLRIEVECRAVTAVVDKQTNTVVLLVDTAADETASAA